MFVILYYLETVERFEHGGVYGLQPGLFDPENMMQKGETRSVAIMFTFLFYVNQKLGIT